MKSLKIFLKYLSIIKFKLRFYFFNFLTKYIIIKIIFFINYCIKSYQSKFIFNKLLHILLTIYNILNFCIEYLKKKIFIKLKKSKK